MDELLKLLEVVRRDLSADDARVELGGRAPEGEGVVWAPLGVADRGWRVVALFDQAPGDLDARAARLRALVAPFGEVVDRAEPPAPRATLKQTELDAELDQLAERAGARAALVIDERSPVLWGCSSLRGQSWDLDTMQRLRDLAAEAHGLGVDPAGLLASDAAESALAGAGLDETQAQRWAHRVGRLASLAPSWDRGEWAEALQIARGVGAARRACKGGRAPERVAAHDDDWGVFAKGFAQIYLLALVYDGAYSELHAEGPLVRALPHIETLVLSLPPVEPPPRGAKVIALKR